ncbi:hypothetical protein [Sinorhizobium fredii]|uniref:hypothetical protein n=1 Tax=Rhizobium fredii TaxID=380 RepID=UPI0004B16DF6|nr:hypothetical protein [Sinorhizobium fredii]
MALVSYVLGDCPGCGAKNSFGNIDVYATRVSLGCGRCTYKESRSLPPITKKILYLDQYFFSHAVRGKDPQFTAAAKLIRELVGLQLLAVPYSDVHEDETHQWAGHEQLLEFIKSTAGGHEFSQTYRVELNQLNKAFEAFLKGQPAAYVPRREDALQDKIDIWDGYYRIEVGGYHGDVDLIRNLKGQAIDGLVALFPGWRGSTNTFEQDVGLEHEAAAKGYLDAYVTFVKRIAEGDFMALMNAPIMSQVIQTLMHHFPSEVAPPERMKHILAFLSSEHIHNTPYHDIQARMYATLKAMVKGGSYMNPEKSIARLSGFYYDVKHISTYAPYCDAFLMDNPMAEIVGRDTVGLTERYGVQVFSRNNWGDFIRWLEALKSGMTNEHKEALRIAYPSISIPA